MNKQLLSLFLGLLCITSAFAQTEDEGVFDVDNAADLLNHLLHDSQQSLADLQAQWAVNEPILQQTIQNLQDLHDAKEAQCDAQEAVLHQTEAALQQAIDSVAWIEGRIQANNDKIASLLEARCAATQAYVEALKHDKIALKLIAFLRAQIQAKDSFSFVERKKMIQRIQSFLQIYRTKNLDALIQLEKDVDASQYDVDVDYSVNRRSADEIGTGHVDNNQADLDLQGYNSSQAQDWNTVKGELLALLDQLEATLNAKMAQATVDEINAGSALADFKIQIEQENQRLAAQLAAQKQLVIQLTQSVADQKAALQQCRSEQDQLQGQVDAAHQDYDNQKADFLHRQSNFNEEIAIFQQVIEIYGDLTANDDSWKDRVDDVEQGEYDESYENREIPDWEFMNN